MLVVLIAVVAIPILKIVGGSEESDSGGLGGTYTRIQDSIAGTQAGCWVASELFGGWYEPQTVAARYYVNNIAPVWFKDLYLSHGEKFAQTLHKHPELKPLIRPLFEHFAEQGAKALKTHS